jgi:4'-phosphopantetheinyl transferase
VDVGAHLGAVRARAWSADIWFAWVSEHAGAVARLSAAMLSETERERMGRYRSIDAAGRYVITRALVRRVLGERLGLNPREVDVRVTDLGKPVVSADMHFNVSHSGDLILMALSADRAVGIDVERRRHVERAGALIARWLTPAEQGSVRDLVTGGMSESDAFLRVWSGKEARLKAIGVGISGATSADLGDVVAVALDDMLPRSATVAEDYVGSVAFA